jgi:hypothetical protein
MQREVRMSDRSLQQLRVRLIGLLRLDPPARGSQGGIERWLLARLSREEIEVMLRAERVYGERAMWEWLGEVLVEAGVAPRQLPLAS